MTKTIYICKEIDLFISVFVHLRGLCHNQGFVHSIPDCVEVFVADTLCNISVLMESTNIRDPLLNSIMLTSLRFYCS